MRPAWDAIRACRRAAPGHSAHLALSTVPARSHHGIPGWHGSLGSPGRGQPRPRPTKASSCRLCSHSIPLSSSAAHQGPSPRASPLAHTCPLQHHRPSGPCSSLKVRPLWFCTCRGMARSACCSAAVRHCCKALMGGTAARRSHVALQQTPLPHWACPVLECLLGIAKTRGCSAATSPLPPVLLGGSTAARRSQVPKVPSPPSVRPTDPPTHCLPSCAGHDGATPHCGPGGLPAGPGRGRRRYRLQLPCWWVAGEPEASPSSANCCPCMLSGTGKRWFWLGSLCTLPSACILRSVCTLRPPNPWPPGAAPLHPQAPLRCSWLRPRARPPPP